MGSKDKFHRFIDEKYPSIGRNIRLLTTLIPAKAYLSWQHKRHMKTRIDWDNPITYNEKIQWMKVYWRDSLATKCADKYSVREFISEKIGSRYLTELHGVYDSVDEININDLPEKFVLKATHGSAMNVICTDKSNMNWKIEKKKLRNWLKTNYYNGNREWVYKDIKPRIICEKFIEQGDGDELRDYRFFCFNGVPKFIGIDFSITNKEKTRRNLYDLDWNLMDAEISYPKETSIKVEKPNKLNEMINLSEKLSEGFPHARVDFYYINNKIIFGEITFFHQGGMGIIRPKEFANKMGSWLKLPQANKRLEG